MQHLIEEIETEWIPLRDGRRLAVRLFLPRSAHRQPAPVVLEYIPYRRRDGTRWLAHEFVHHLLDVDSRASATAG